MAGRLGQQQLEHANPGQAKRHWGGSQIQSPCPGSLATYQGNRLVEPALQPQQPVSQRLRVVLAQRFQISNLESGAFRSGNHLSNGKKLAVGEDVAPDETAVAAAADPRHRLSLSDAGKSVTEQEPCPAQHTEHVREILDYTGLGDLFPHV